MTEHTETQQTSVEAARPMTSSLPPTVLINLSTPGSRVSICRVGTKQELLGDGTVKQLLERCISLRSPLSMAVPIAQLESEMSAVLAIGELMAADTGEVLLRNPDGTPERTVYMDEPVHAIARERTGEQGNVFYSIDLEVRLAEGYVTTTIEERRQVTPPKVVEVKPPPPPVAAVPPQAIPTIPVIEKPAAPSEIPTIPPLRQTPQPPAEPLAAPVTGAPPAAAASSVVESPMIGAKLPRVPTKPEPDTPKNVVVIVAGPQKKALSKTAQEMKDKGYARKSDFLRAQFLPEVEALDFSGLFVGEFGLGIRRDQERKNVVLADPSRITAILLQGNAFRRSGNHVKALTAYQELADMDPSNPDFRFLMGKALMELGRGEEAMGALARAKELGHEGARKEMETLKAQGHRPREPLGFLRFWKR